MGPAELLAPTQTTAPKRWPGTPLGELTTKQRKRLRKAVAAWLIDSGYQEPAAVLLSGTVVAPTRKGSSEFHVRWDGPLGTARSRQLFEATGGLFAEVVTTLDSPWGIATVSRTVHGHHPRSAGELFSFGATLAVLHRCEALPGLGIADLGWVTAPTANPAPCGTDHVWLVAAASMSGPAGVALALVRTEPLVLTHGDPHPGNALIRSANGGVVLVDPDHCSMGSATVELATACALVRVADSQDSSTTSSKGRDALIRGYCEAAGTLPPNWAAAGPAIEASAVISYNCWAEKLAEVSKKDVRAFTLCTTGLTPERFRTASRAAFAALLRGGT